MTAARPLRAATIFLGSSTAITPSAKTPANCLTAVRSPERFFELRPVPVAGLQKKLLDE